MYNLLKLYGDRDRMVNDAYHMAIYTTDMG